MQSERHDNQMKARQGNSVSNVEQNFLADSQTGDQSDRGIMFGNHLASNNIITDERDSQNWPSLRNNNNNTELRQSVQKSNSGNTSATATVTKKGLILIAEEKLDA